MSAQERTDVDSYYTGFQAVSFASPTQLPPAPSVHPCNSQTAPLWEPKLLGYWSLQENFRHPVPGVSGETPSGLMDMFLPSSFKRQTWSYESNLYNYNSTSSSYPQTTNPSFSQSMEDSSMYPEALHPSLPPAQNHPYASQSIMGRSGEIWNRGPVQPLPQIDQDDQSESEASSPGEGEEDEENGDSGGTAKERKDLVVSGRFQLQLEVQARVRNRSDAKRIVNGKLGRSEFLLHQLATTPAQQQQQQPIALQDQQQLQQQPHAPYPYNTNMTPYPHSIPPGFQNPPTHEFMDHLK